MEVSYKSSSNDNDLVLNVLLNQSTSLLENFHVSGYDESSCNKIEVVVNSLRRKKLYMEILNIFNITLISITEPLKNWIENQCIQSDQLGFLNFYFIIHPYIDKVKVCIGTQELITTAKSFHQILENRFKNTLHK